MPRVQSEGEASVTLNRQQRKFLGLILDRCCGILLGCDPPARGELGAIQYPPPASTRFKPMRPRRKAVSSLRAIGVGSVVGPFVWRQPGIFDLR